MPKEECTGRAFDSMVRDLVAAIVCWILLLVADVERFEWEGDVIWLSII